MDGEEFPPFQRIADALRDGLVEESTGHTWDRFDLLFIGAEDRASGDAHAHPQCGLFYDVPRGRLLAMGFTRKVSQLIDSGQLLMLPFNVDLAFDAATPARRAKAVALAHMAELADRLVLSRDLGVYGAGGKRFSLASD